MGQKRVYICHCIDTEGPLFESLDATFERLREIFNLDFEPSRKTLERLQRGEIDLGGKGEAVQKVVAPELLDYNDTWDKVGHMLDEALSESFRMRLPDDEGNGWVYNWFCVDHVDYGVNPRQRTMGYHGVFDHYRRVIRRTDSMQDSVQFHFHPHDFRKRAHRSATHWWANSDALYQILSRRILERDWFPAANRPGFHVTRPDSHWFLEQFVPFDFASQAIEIGEDEEQQSDIVGARLGDWRRAPKTWVPYHPHHDDYQRRGDCRRWIARCLNVGTRAKLLSEKEIAQAFKEASEERPVVLGLTNHDFRDIRTDIDAFRKRLEAVASEFPGVDFVYEKATTAMRQALGLSDDACEFETDITRVGDETHKLCIEANCPTFGPQPYLALKTSGGQYFHDNFDIEKPFRGWSYIFDESTYELDDLASIGFGANSSGGVTTVGRFETETREWEFNYWNQS